MPKGLFTQSAIILLRAPVPLEQIQLALSTFKIGKSMLNKSESWMGGSVSVVLVMREEVNGLAIVDQVNKPWPDKMGDPKGTAEETDIFGAWAMGFFGPNVYPGNLARSKQNRVAEDLKSAAESHTAILRIRTSYAMGLDKNAKILPEDYDPLSELYFVTNIASALLKLPQALAYFNPNGEVLKDAQGLLADLKHFDSLKLPPLPVWMAVRLFNVDAEWRLSDSVGMDQLFVTDSEACYSVKKHDPNQVSRFLWNVGDYLRQKGPVIKSGETMNGPGDVNWRAFTCENSICTPPRRTLRWFPLDGTKAPKQLIPTGNKPAK